MALIIRKNKNGFSVLIEKFTPERHYERLESKDFHTFNLSPAMKYEEAKAAAKAWAKQQKLEKKKKVNSFLRATFNKDVQDTYLPQGLVQEFESSIAEMYPDSEERHETVLQHWRSAQRLICSIESLPTTFYEKRFLIYNYFKKQKWSADYMKRITKIMNQWAAFYGRKLQTFVDPVPKIQGSWKQKVLDSRFEKDYVRQPALPFTFKMLNAKKTKMINDSLEAHFNFLYIGLAFGLRPSEIDSLQNTKTWRVDKDSETKLQVLHVYQKKLNAIEHSRRWKPIPIVTPEQKEAFRLIQSKNHIRPLTKTIKRFFGDGYDTYSPRKGFTDEMLKLGFQLTDVSVFLGHSSITTTWNHYKNKQAFQVPEKFKKGA